MLCVNLDQMQVSLKKFLLLFRIYNLNYESELYRKWKVKAVIFDNGFTYYDSFFIIFESASTSLRNFWFSNSRFDIFIFNS